jgi:hypothetical protein
MTDALQQGGDDSAEIQEAIYPEKVNRKKRPHFRPRPPAVWIRRGMKLPFILASIVCSLAWADGSEATARAKKAVSSRKLGLNIQVQGGGWGPARKESIETVLTAVAEELMTRLPGKLGAPIIVTHTDGPPVALYGRGAQGEYRIRLHARGENWHLYAYEFAHELCHVLSNFDEHVEPGAEPTRYNQWFEETLCETASLFTLKSLARTWERAPPAPEWADEAKTLRRFFDVLIAEGHRQLPPQAPLARWLHDNEDALRHDPYLRQKNEVIANLLLPLFDSNPENWQALGYLNLDPTDARSSLRTYLSHWYNNAPPEHRALVVSVLELLSLGDVVLPPSLDLSRRILSTTM